MANPRDTVNFNEIGYHATSYLRQASGTGAIDFLPSVTNPYSVARSTQQGFSASIVTAKTARVGQSGDRLLGKLVVINDDVVSVQDKGYAYFSYIAGANAPVVGGMVVCDGSGGVRNVIASSEFNGAHTHVVDLDATNLVATVLMR